MLLSNTKVNLGRQPEIDLLKAFTVVFSMIIIHVYDYATVGFKDDFVWWIDIIFGGIFAAPLFMFCMGTGMEYSRNNDAGQTALRGLRLLTMGQVLNLFRYALIFLILGQLDRAYDYRPAQALNFSSDIMQLAGLSFLLMGLFRKLKLKNWMILLIAVAMSICGTLLEEVQTGIYAVDQIFGFFWGTDTESFFPLLNWFIFIAAGKCFGSIYQRVENKTKFFLTLAPIGIAVFAAVWHLQLHTGTHIFNSFDEGYKGFSWMRLPDSLSVVLIAPTVIGLFYLFTKLLPEKVVSVASHPSKHINQYYCVSWWWIMVIHMFAWADNMKSMISVWLNVLTFTILTVVLYNDYFKESVEAFCSRHKTVLIILVWVITLGAAFYAFSVCPELPNEFNNYLMDVE